MFSKLPIVFVLVSTLSAAQGTGVLRVRVAIDGTPIPRVVLLVSDNPSTNEPRRVRTGPDGTVELKLLPGLYTVESDQPFAFGGNAYTWTQMITVAAGQPAVLELTAANAELESAAGAAARTGTALLVEWQDSVVEIWTPTTHASGFVIDRRGVIATSYHALKDATTVEVEFAAAGKRMKVPGSVLLSDRLTGAALVRVDPALTTPVRPIDPGCARSDRSAPAFKDELTVLAAPMFAPKSLSGGGVTRITSQAVFTDMTLARDSAGSPVFVENGELAGIGAIAEGDDGPRRWSEAWVVPIDKMCEAMAAADKKMSGAPPPGTLLPVDPAPTAPSKPDRTAASAKAQPAALSSADFDITLMTSLQVQSGAVAISPRSDFMNWSDYVSDAPPVMLIRVSPQFEESFWKTLARGAAATQGMALPPLKSFSPNFLRLRAYCGDAEVTPIHPFTIERQVAEKAFIREGLYVFPIDAFGAHCGSVRLAMYSEKDPLKADVKTIEPQLFVRVASRAAAP